MEGDGWTKNGDGVWAKDGKTATFAMHDAGRQQAPRPHGADAAVAAGRCRIRDDDQDQVTPADLFGTIAPDGDFQVGPLGARRHVPGPDAQLDRSPRRTSRRMRTASPASTSTARTSPASTTCSTQVDTEIDVDARIAASQGGRRADRRRTCRRCRSTPCRTCCCGAKGRRSAADQPDRGSVLEPRRVGPRGLTPDRRPDERKEATT